MLIGRLVVVAVLLLGGVVGDITTTTTSVPLGVSAYATRDQVWPGDAFSVVVTLWTNTSYLAVVTINPVLPLPDRFSVAVTSASTGAAEGASWAGGVSAAGPAVITYQVVVTADAPVGGRDMVLGFDVSYGMDTEPRVAYRKLVQVPVRVGLATAHDPKGVERVYVPVIRR